MEGRTLRTLEVSTPATVRLSRARRRTAATQVLILICWGLLLPLILMLPFEGLLPAPVNEAVAFLLVACLLLGFALCIPEGHFRKRQIVARHAAFPEVESALGRLRAGWELEWNAPYGAFGRERLVSLGSWKERFEWRVSYRGGAMHLTEIPAAEHETDEAEDD